MVQRTIMSGDRGALLLIPLPRTNKGDDETDSSIVLINEVRNLDILMGRGRLCADHIGTIAFKALVGSRVRDYHRKDFTKSDKIHLVVELIRMVSSEGGRFLQYKRGKEYPNDNCEVIWFQTTESSETRKKVRDCIRDALKMKNSFRALGLRNRVDYERFVTEEEEGSTTLTFADIVARVSVDPIVKTNVAMSPEDVPSVDANHTGQTDRVLEEPRKKWAGAEASKKRNLDERATREHTPSPPLLFMSPPFLLESPCDSLPTDLVQPPAAFQVTESPHANLERQRFVSPLEQQCHQRRHFSPSAYVHHPSQQESHEHISPSFEASYQQLQQAILVKSGPESWQQEAYIVSSLERLTRLQYELERSLVNIRQRRRSEELQNRRALPVLMVSDTSNGAVTIPENVEPIALADPSFEAHEHQPESLDEATTKNDEEVGHGKSVSDKLDVFAVKDTVPL
jgi:hypothetical protein